MERMNMIPLNKKHKKTRPIKKIKSINYQTIKLAAAAKLLIEKGIIIRECQSFHSIALIIIRAYGYNFKITQKHLCSAFVRKYVVGDQAPITKTQGQALSQAMSAWYKSNAFLKSEEWQLIRYRILQKYGAKCQCCGGSKDTGTHVHVDHIKPRSIYPELAVDENNLQVLCAECNKGKSNLYEKDWRK